MNTINKRVWAGIAAALLLAASCQWRTEPLPSRAIGPQPKASPAGAPAEKPALPDIPPLSLDANLLTDTARFLAGLSVDRGGPFASLAQTDAWMRYAKDAESQWDRFKAGEAKMRAWAREELANVFDPARPVFYPFSGPDITFADIFLAGANEYVLVGLEDVGSVPREVDLAGRDLGRELALYIKSLDDLLGLSFFRTNDMKEDLANPTIDGVVPIIMVLLARLDKEILAIEFGDLDAAGRFCAAPNEAPGRRKAVTILFRGSGDPQARTIRYFSANLYDGEFLKNAPLRAFFDRELAPCFTFLKSASYLMHHSFFGAIRKKILEMSYAILQDDSAIPFRRFDRAVWDLSLYGRYDGPIKLFEDDFEQELFDAYRTTPGIKPLNFRFGYSPLSDILLAIKKKGN
jgi:hypothetical protein